MKSGHRPRRRSCLKVFPFLALVQPSGTIFSNFANGVYEEHICEIILKLCHWSRRCRLKVFSIFSAGGHFVQLSRTL